jgi:hypothetical protein
MGSLYQYTSQSENVYSIEIRLIHRHRRLRDPVSQRIVGGWRHGVSCASSASVSFGNKGSDAWLRWVFREGFQQGNVEKLPVCRFDARPAARVVAL